VTGAEAIHRAIAAAGAVTVSDSPGSSVVVPLVADGGIGLAAGIALSGKPTVVTVTSAARVVAGLEALRHAANTDFACPLVVRVPVGGQAGPHVDAEILGLLHGLEVWTGSSADELVAAIRQGLAGSKPVVVLEPRTVLFERAASPTAAPGDQITVIAWGDGVQAAIDAGVGVLAIRRLSPLDPAVGPAVRRTGRAVVVHNGEVAWAQRAVAAVLAEAFEYLESPPIAVPAHAADIAAAVEESIQF
jgi:pyruvate/2-oxoglutarate/acetoin dehydrogenase E1 component